MRERLSRPLWLAVVLVAFCAPLFVGLDRTDMENDEAIYSYAVDSILSSGDWLNPVLSPFPNTTFLEKPPLKFWIVAAPIAAGILPHTHWALRVWDALFGAIAFVYVFLIGRRLAGSVCGFVAVFALFIYGPLLQVHGLRNNNMEAPLVLSYCGGIYHYLAWATRDDRGGRRGHAAAVMLYFFLGFMTKFVAVFFLPILLAAATLVHPPTLRRLLGEWRWWALLVIAFVALAAPWFLYQYNKEGTGFLRVIFAEHVYTRFTTALDPHHIKPWNFYFVELYAHLQHLGTFWLACVGGALLIVEAIRRPSFDKSLVISWFVVPMALMTIGTSKLHHYLYPFLPPIALAIGYGPAWVLTAGRPVVDRAMDAAHGWIAGRAWSARVRTGLLVAAAIAVVIAVATAIFGKVDLEAGGVTILRNSHAARPLVIALVLATLAGQGAVAARVLLPGVVLIAILPVNEYENTLKDLTREEHSLRTVSDCLLRVRSKELAAGRRAPGVYAIGGERWFLHSYFYYLHDIGGWEGAPALDEAKVEEGLSAPGLQRPIMISDDAYQTFKAHHPGRLQDVPAMRLRDVLLLAPGPYAPCVPTPAPAAQ